MDHKTGICLERVLTTAGVTSASVGACLLSPQEAFAQESVEPEAADEYNLRSEDQEPALNSLANQRSMTFPSEILTQESQPGLFSFPSILGASSTFEDTSTFTLKPRFLDLHSKREERRILTLELRNPFLDFDPNSRAYFSVSQAGGLLNDLLSNAGMENSALGRLGLAAFTTYFNWVDGYISHEMAHEYLIRRTGVHTNTHFDFSDWSSYIFPEYIKSENVFKLYRPSDFPDEESLNQFIEETLEQGLVPVTNADMKWSNAAGLYQSEFNSDFAFRQRILNEDMPVDSVFAQFMPQTADSLYALLSLGGYGGDPIAYVKLMRMEPSKVDYSLEQMAAYTILSDLLSFSVLEGFYDICNYIVTGEYAHKPRSFSAGGVDIIPPKFMMLPSIDGMYIDMELPISFDDKYLFINLGTGIDTWGDGGNVNRVRFGGQLYSIESGDPQGLSIQFNPFAYLNLTTHGSYAGHFIGVETEIGFGSDLSIDIGVQHENNDFIESTIKRADSEFRLRIGFTLKY